MWFVCSKCGSGNIGIEEHPKFKRIMIVCKDCGEFFIPEMKPGNYEKERRN